MRDIPEWEKDLRDSALVGLDGSTGDPIAKAAVIEIAALRRRAALWKKAAKFNFGADKSASLHADLNRRAARALGKPFSGLNSSWHDIPEQIEAMRFRIDAAIKFAEMKGSSYRAVEDVLNILKGEFLNG